MPHDGVSYDRPLTLTLSIVSETFSVCRLPPDVPPPEWAQLGCLTSVTRTSDELSIVCPAGNVPDGVAADAGWRCFKVEGPLDLALTGVIAGLAAPLAAAGISIFPIATYDTDYLLVRADDFERAADTLTQHGHHISSATKNLHL
jgi:hypothetical protein